MFICKIWKGYSVKEKNITIEYIKGVAIVSVICAHCNAILDTSNRMAVFSSLLLQNFGTLGVICFFVISGILFHYPENGIRKFFKKKIKNIIFPWLISATCVYLYVHLRKPPLSINGWLNFVFGNGSYCYYLTELMILYITFIILSFLRTNVGLLLCEGVTIIFSIWFWKYSDINPYLNILNWIGYFALGIQIAKYPTIWSHVKNIICTKFFSSSIVLGYMILLGYQIYNQKGGSYWDGINVIACWSGATTLALFAHYLVNVKNCKLSKIIHQIGVDSFAIYIWHMPIAGIVARIMCIDLFSYFVLIRPIIVLGLIYIFFGCVKKIFPKQVRYYIGI